METLQEMIENSKTGFKASKDKPPVLSENMDLLLGQTPLKCEQDGVNKALGRLAKEYFRHKMGEKYDLLSYELFELKRRMKVSTEEFEGTIDLPVLAWSWYGNSHWKHEFKKESESYDSYSKKKHTTEITVKTKTPLIPAEIKESASEAMAYSHEVCADALRNKSIRNYLATQIRTPEKITELVEPSLAVIWKPRLEDLSVEVETTEEVIETYDPDPALLLRFNKDYYLIATWDIPEEEPLDHYLREFKI